MDFIAPEYRGKGLAHMLYKARIDWAQKHPDIEKLHISHREDNEASRRTMIAHGFEPDGKSRIRFGDGQEDTDHSHALYLKK